MASNVTPFSLPTVAISSSGSKDSDYTKTRNENTDLGERGSHLEVDRRPFILTCLSWRTQGRYIIFWANPREIQWSFKLRGTTTQVKGGTITYVWRDGTRQSGAPNAGGSSFYDEPRLNITFQTGNCMPVIGEGANVSRLPPGLVDLYDFLELMNEPLVLDDGSANYRILTYNSIAFPQMVLYGMFQPEVEFQITETADNPGQLSWNHTFIVRRSMPHYANAAALARYFQDYSLGVSENAIGLSEEATQRELITNSKNVPLQPPIKSDRISKQ